MVRCGLTAAGSRQGKPADSILMWTLKPQFFDAALPTSESFIKQTKTARFFHHAQAVREVVTCQRLQSVWVRATNDEKLGHIRRMSPFSARSPSWVAANSRRRVAHGQRAFTHVVRRYQLLKSWILWS
jgi:hypothetical protein